MSRDLNREAPVHGDDGPGDERGRIGAKPQDSLTHIIFGITHPTKGNAFDHPLPRASYRGGDVVREHGPGDRAGAHAVYPDTEPTRLERRHLGEYCEAGLGGTVGGEAGGLPQRLGR